MNNSKILIVEDEAIIAMELESQLQSLGYEITSIVDTGAKAIKKAEEDKPDIILMDIRIKGEMDGIDTAEEIRNRFGIPVIFSTAYLDQERIERAKITMPFGYVLKPIQDRDLKVTLEMALYVAKVNKERRKTEETLQESQVLLQTAMDQSQAGIAIADAPDGKLRYVNDAGLGIRGRSKEEIVNGVGVEQYVESWQILHLDGTPYKSDEVPLARAVIYGETNSREFIIRRPDDEDRIVLANAAPILNNKGKITAGIVIFLNITEQKKAEEALRESAFFFSQMFEQSTASSCFLNPKGDLIRVNPKFCEIFGVEEKVILGRGYNIFQDPAAKDAGVIPLIKELFDEKKPQYWQMNFDIELASTSTGIPTSKNKTVNLEVFGYPILNDAGELQSIVLQHYDITSRLQAQKALTESEEKHRTLFDTMTQGVVYQNAEGIIIDANPAAERILGLSLSQLQGKTSMDPRWKAIHEDGSDFPGENHPIPMALKTGKPVKNVIHGVFHPDNKEYRWIRVNAVPKFRKGESAPYEAYAIFEDITDERERKK